MSVIIELSPEVEQMLRRQAAVNGQSIAEAARVLVEQGLLEQSQAVAAEERRLQARALLRKWREAPPDLEEADGYPEHITPFRAGIPDIG